MSTVVSAEARIQSVSVNEDTIIAELQDGRTISVPWVVVALVGSACGATFSIRDPRQRLGNSLGGDRRRH
jgi:hypothetical protein